jgi:hypothetical protein
MKKLCLIFVPFLSVLTGCAESYLVSVDGFAEAKNPVPQNARIFVAADPNSENPLFDKETKAKIEKLLASHGFQPVDDPAAEYRLTFHFGIRSRPVEDVDFISGYSLIGEHNVVVNGGYYAPYVRNVWDQMLRIKVFRGSTAVWVCEAVTSKYYADKRQAVDYLLIGTFEFFGQNTSRQETVEIKEKDPRIAALGSYTQ